MRISFNTRVKSPQTITGSNGYGYATNCMLDSFRRQGFDWDYNDPTADVGLVFDQPQHAEWYPEQYKIIYHPWESTKLQKGWSEIMNTADEVWTPSPLIADWYQRYAGIKKPVFVYEHGIDHVWEPRRRNPEGPIKILLVGIEATRKNGWQAISYIRRALGEDYDYRVTAKMMDSPWNQVGQLGGVTYINERYSFDELQELFYTHDLLVHISSGEGFGLPPLQALASGMPTIALPDWAPYSRFMDPNLCVDSRLISSPWPKLHPGRMFRPQANSVISCLRYAAENKEDILDRAFDIAPQIHEEYDWDRLTLRTFKELENRLSK